MSIFGIRTLVDFGQQQSFLESERLGNKETLVNLGCCLFQMPQYSVILYSLNRRFNYEA